MTDTLFAKIDASAADIRRYLGENAATVLVLCLAAIAAYGFELFNLNLTIDEEVQAFMPYGSIYISHGRWGLFLLNKFLLTYPVIPFVPVFLALCFHVAGILLLLQCWGGPQDRSGRMTAGSLAVVYPGMAYFFMFSTSNYAIALGLLLTALSLYILVRSDTWLRFASVVPAVLALSIYQGLAVSLVCCFIAWLVAAALRGGSVKVDVRKAFEMVCVAAAAAAGYYLITLSVLHATGIKLSYVDALFDVPYLRANPASVLARTASKIWEIYSGSRTIYANEIRSFGVVLLFSLFGLMSAIFRSSLAVFHKLLVFALALLLLILPFAAGLLLRGDVPVRFMLSLPVVISAVVLTGFRGHGRGARMAMIGVAAYCIFQCIVSVNYLNSSSHLALQADRMFASQVISRIEDARSAAGVPEIKYLEVVGYRERPASLLMPKSDTVGASFFEWDQGHDWRIIFFLRTLGYYNNVDALPAERRAALFETAKAMPKWPAPGSVRVEGDAAVVKFGDYSPFQKNEICGETHRREFCK